MSRMLAWVAGALPALSLAVVPAAAQTKPELLFQAEAQTLAGTCTGQPVRLEGNHNTVTLTGSCGSLLLKGVANTVRMGIAAGGSIHVEGSGNRVLFAGQGTPPAIVALGPDNDVEPGSAPEPARGPAPAPAPEQAPGPPPPSGPPVPAAAPLPAVSQSPAKPSVPSPAQAAKPAPTANPVAAEPLALSGSDQHRLEDCAGQDVTVTGERSAYVIRGGCKSLAVRGDLLTIQAELAPGAKVTVTGRGSIVSWAMKGKGRAPASVVHGEGSRVQRADAIGGEAVLAR